MSMFTADEVTAALDSRTADYRVITKEVTGSTNNDVKALAEQGAPEYTVVISGEQTAGKGRLGRSFYSPKDAGIYMSILLRPALGTADALAITTCAAVAVAQAVEEFSGVVAGIKWVNDIYIAGRKICGILTESSVDGSGRIKYAVLGIGINVTDVGFPEDIRTKAAAIGCGTEIRPVLAAKVLELFAGYYSDLPSKSYMDEYRRRSVLTGKRVDYIHNGSAISADVLGIDDDARLIVKNSDGIVSHLGSGEVTVTTPVSEL